MGTLFDARDRDAVARRLDTLTPDRRPQWGRMAPPEMICHVSSALECGLGSLTATPVRGPLARPPLNWLAIHVLPWPRGKMQSAPEFLHARPGAWATDLQRLRELIERFGAKGPGGDWPVHPVLGRISGRSWGVLQHRHLDYHLRQFGA